MIESFQAPVLTPSLSGGEMGFPVEPEAPETFTDEQITFAIAAWLEYGENSYVKEKIPGNAGHCGYFSGIGWAARCLRFHFERLKQR